MPYIKMTESEKRAKAASMPIDGPYRELALLVRRMLGWEIDSQAAFMTTRDAARKTGVSYSTISSMA